MFESLYSTGCRISEMTAVKWGEIDFDRGTLIVTGKGSKERLVILGGPALAALRALRTKTAEVDPAFAEDEKKLAELIEKLDAFSKDPQGTPTEVLKTGVGLFRNIEYMASKLFSFASLRQSVNTSDTEASAACGRLYQLTAGIAGPNARLTTYIAGLEDVDAIIESDPLLKEHSFFLHNIRENSKHILSPETEQAISLYEVSGSGAWSDLQSYLTSIVPVEYKGEKTNLSDIRNKAYDPDPEVRKEAYEAEIKAYDRIKDAIAYSLNSIKMEVISRCKLKGYESPLAETLENAHMTRATLDALIGAMVEYLPKFWEYMKAKAKLLVKVIRDKTLDQAVA